MSWVGGRNRCDFLLWADKTCDSPQGNGSANCGNVRGGGGVWCVLRAGQRFGGNLTGEAVRCGGGSEEGARRIMFTVGQKGARRNYEVMCGSCRLEGREEGPARREGREKGPARRKPRGAKTTHLRGIHQAVPYRGPVDMTGAPPPNYTAVSRCPAGCSRGEALPQTAAHTTRIDPRPDNQSQRRYGRQIGRQGPGAAAPLCGRRRINNG
ncbi:hypothetical protein Bbelb_358000 [Branchiostoma belcheri]|nr:hypothetical protein Bbelb_358000 [Branchiostoma belcheri]